MQIRRIAALRSGRRLVSSVVFTAAGVAAALSMACSGDSEAGSESEDTAPTTAPTVPGVAGSPSGAPAGGGTGNAPSDDTPPGEPEGSPPTAEDLPADPASLEDGVPSTSRVMRIAPSDLDRVLSDLLGFDVEVADSFPGEQPTLGPYYDRSELDVNERFYTELVRSSESLAQQVVDDESGYASVVGCDADAPGCSEEFVEAFGRRAFRRPLTEDETPRYMNLFERGDELIGSGDAFRDGVQLVVEAMLQSPKFWYQLEQGGGGSDAAGVVLSDFEIAARLASTIWGSIPDDALLDAAERGELRAASGRESQAGRLLDDQRARERIADFHERWLALSELSGLSKDAEAFPEFSTAMAERMRQETLRFVEEVVSEQNGGLRELLTAPFSFVDRELAELYGIEGGTGGELARVDFAPGDARGGVLTQGAFLTGHTSTSVRTSPILRGVFVLRELACETVPPPPPGAESMEPETPDDTITTTREFFEWKTSVTGCSSCHATINPVGFAFEEFDAIGRHRTEENGAPIDASGSVTLSSGVALSFDGVKDLARQFAELESARFCYAQNWLRYGYARPDTNADLRTLALMTEGLGVPGYGVRDMLLDLTASAAFSHLAE